MPGYHNVCGKLQRDKKYQLNKKIKHGIKLFLLC